MSKETINHLRRVLEIFSHSEGEIRPHFILTGPSGSGKTHTIQALVDELELGFLGINAAQLTKEGTAGNSLSKALAPLLYNGTQPTVVFADEFDKLFISGNSNSALAHEVTHGVQNEFLKVLEGRSTSVYGDYGKYVDIPTSQLLFIFAGAFNNEENISLDRLRDFGIKTEFLGRVGLTFALNKLTLTEMEEILVSSPLLDRYLLLFPKVNRAVVIRDVMNVVRQSYEKNTIGVRMINTLIHRYFIHGGLTQKVARRTTFQKTLTLTKD